MKTLLALKFTFYLWSSLLRTFQYNLRIQLKYFADSENATNPDSAEERAIIVCLFVPHTIYDPWWWLWNLSWTCGSHCIRLNQYQQVQILSGSQSLADRRYLRPREAVPVTYRRTHFKCTICLLVASCVSLAKIETVNEISGRVPTESYYTPPIIEQHRACSSVLRTHKSSLFEVCQR